MIKNKTFYPMFLFLYILLALYCHPVLACRLILMVAPFQADTKQEEKIIKNLLIDDRLSLINQSKMGIKKKYFNLITIEDVDGLYTNRGNPDGWGIIQYKNGIIEKPIKSALPAYKDSLFSLTAKSAAKNAPDILMAHIRLASSNMSVNEKNVHPFVYKNWSFMHNGFVDIKDVPVIVNQMKEYKEKFNLIPEGNTDSETIFFYFLGKMTEKQKTLNTKPLSQQDIIDSFASTILDMRQYSKISLRDFSNKETIYEGKCIKSPTMNLITTNGQLVIAYKQNKSLFLGMIKNKNKEGEFFIISSEMTNPVTSKDIEWYEIPDDSMVIINKETQKIQMLPIECFMQH